MGRPEFDQVLNLEARSAQETNHIAMRKMKLDAWIVRVLNTMHAEGGTQQSFIRGNAVFIRNAQRQQE